MKGFIKKLHRTKIITSLCLVIILSGCAPTTTYVSSIGARTIHGNSDTNKNTNDININLIDSKLVMNEWALMHFASVPYSSFVPEQGEVIGDISVDYSEINWISENEGTVSVLMKGAIKDFKVTKSKSEGVTSLTFTSDYREWYGYPAQALVTVSVPVDIVIDVVLVAGFIIAAPIVYGYQAITE